MFLNETGEAAEVIRVGIHRHYEPSIRADFLAQSHGVFHGHSSCPGLRLVVRGHARTPVALDLRVWGLQKPAEPDQIEAVQQFQEPRVERLFLVRIGELRHDEPDIP